MKASPDKCHSVLNCTKQTGTKIDNETTGLDKFNSKYRRQSQLVHPIKKQLETLLLFFIV